MTNINESPESMLNTEGGMFQVEISDKIVDAFELIEISTIQDKIKKECREVLEGLIRRSETEKDKTDVVDLCRSAVVDLLNILDVHDTEQEQLFEGVKKIILNARNSVKGWKIYE